MFLAFNEIRHSKFRYALIIGVMFLIAYLVFFLTGLAYGLAQENRVAVDQWDADAILLSTDSNNNLGMSMIPIKDFDEVDASEKAVLAQTPGVVQKVGAKKSDDKISVSFFGIRSDEFIMPEVVEGEAFENNDEGIADISIKEEYGIELGDELKLSGQEKTIKIVGFVENAKFSVSPVIYTTIGAYQEIRFEKTDDSPDARINGIVVRGDVTAYPEDDLDKIEISQFISELPGYNAQVLTFGFMIGFLIVIAAIVIGIFIYVLTMQKVSIFGVMKAQGISSGYIASSVIVQTFLLAIIGVGLGFIGTYGTALFLPTAVPFQSNFAFFGIIGLLMVFFALFGAVFSVKTIVKIDPLKAIG
ncbi:MAG TPA: ABC transporter permease [Enterococcus aquimarinus]|nr:ABC transporter permease [Enterococcus sp.]MBP9638768.1 ABC transporter permease [Enterococcus sp.]HRL51159.1 ABC transporter permease [Enterococcus aquimarinus]HRM23780.1 ABC transporter permease [Enterococcus aquimarinus]